MAEEKIVAVVILLILLVLCMPLGFMLWDVRTQRRWMEEEGRLFEVKLAEEIKSFRGGQADVITLQRPKEQ